MKSSLLPARNITYERFVDEEDGSGPQHRIRASGVTPSRLVLVLLLSLLPICTYTHWMLGSSLRKDVGLSKCDSVSKRREWRTLTMPQKYEYLSAVQCLKTRPSKLGLDHTLYDDFPYIHSRVGGYGRPQTSFNHQSVDLSAVHDAAPFLAWHRYFVYIYETALKKECGYTGNMP
jgi:hypothetical protein